MQGRSNRFLTDRDLRALSTRELVDLIQQDVKDLDKVWRERRRHVPPPPDPFAKPPPPARGGRRAPGSSSRAAAEPDVEELVTLHRVSCCDNYLGDFVPIARVRCPFCETWHQARDFPALT